MIGHYLSSDNEMCYNTKTNNFSPTKHGTLYRFHVLQDEWLKDLDSVRRSAKLQLGDLVETLSWGNRYSTVTEMDLQE